MWLRTSLIFSLAAFGAFAAAPAQAEKVELYAIYQIEAAELPTGNLALSAGDYVLKQRLVPMGLAVIDEPAMVAKPERRLEAGTQLIAVGHPKHRLFCDATRYKKKANDTALACLADTDGDDRFDASFKGLSMTGAIISLQGRLNLEKLHPIEPVSYRSVEPNEFDQNLFVAIQRRNFFNIYSRESFTIEFGNSEFTEELTRPIQFKNEEMPKEMTVLGSRFTALSETDGVMTVRVDRAMPPQPFGVMRTVTYR